MAAQQAGGNLSDFFTDPSKSFVLEDARLGDGSDEQVREHVTIVIENGRITHVGPAPQRAPASQPELQRAAQREAKPP